MTVTRILFYGLLISGCCVISILSWDETCRGKVLQHADLSEQTAKNIQGCLEVVNTKTYKELNDENRACFYKCLMERQGRFDSDGKIIKEKVANAMYTLMPEEVREEHLIVTTKCLDDFADQAKYNETSCESFTPLIDCTHKSFQQACGHN